MGFEFQKLNHNNIFISVNARDGNWGRPRASSYGAGEGKDLNRRGRARLKFVKNLMGHGRAGLIFKKY